MMLNVALNPTRLYETATITYGKLFKHRELLLEQIKQEVIQPHAGQLFGGIWFIVQPLFMMLVYVLVFAIVFKSRVGGTYELPLDYTAYILSGVIPWLAIQQAMMKSCAALSGHANLIRQVVFPIEVLPTKAVVATFVPLLISLTALFFYVIVTTGGIPWTYLLVPVLIAIQLLWVIGLAFILSALSVFIRDIRELVLMFANAGLFLLPILYLPKWVPSVFKPIIYINPFSALIWVYRDVLYYGRFEHPWAWVIAIMVGLVLFLLGSRTFDALKPYFGDVLR